MSPAIGIAAGREDRVSVTSTASALQREETAVSAGIALAPGHRGSNQSGMRAYNERLVLTLVRRHGGISKSEIARLTGLSNQTVSVIMRQLEADGLLVRGEPMRGKVGQPSVPLSLNPRGAWFMGLKIGRRSADFVVVDFLGNIVRQTSRTYAWPLPEETVAFAAAEIALTRQMLGAEATRIAGLGIAMPFELWAWAEEVDAPAAEMDRWHSFDVGAAIQAVCPCPVYVQNDATAACGAELAFGTNPHRQDFIYFYIGTFVGGGVVLNGSLYTGRTGNAGALGSMPVPGGKGISEQLIDQASLVVLERRLKAHGVDPSPLWTAGSDWSSFEKHTHAWLETAARGLAHAIIAAASVIDFEAAMIDGGFPAHIRARLVERVSGEIMRIDSQGIAVPKLEEGAIGPVARALGGASLPLFERFLIDQNTLMRDH
jgi:predicted NBD/HSP70 family sugar kinase